MTDPAWILWLGGIAAALVLIYLLAVLFNAELLD
ncbi:potassium-transporting ATPase subunit F [Mesosutterella sp. AGMB02718]|uniref:Potassium-transporting ATPase subunit F n=1 Tax=Mesosutterella faecium TaxID=2925194 RepID=A0ABT7IJN6_9BURK|nr:potassium-transporting ATPase subunit F [Mesosutterella sp. AGMB02718]MDL2058579.1 potassium-transporting ATPase subunit F [Mesosutterella sp. AGMB02718]